MSKADKVDEELRALIDDVIGAGLLAQQTQGLAVARQVSEMGLGALTPGERRIWEQEVLPVLSKPLQEQIAIASILRRGGYVPRKIAY